LEEDNAISEREKAIEDKKNAREKDMEERKRVRDSIREARMIEYEARKQRMLEERQRKRDSIIAARENRLNQNPSNNDEGEGEDENGTN